MTGTSRIGRKSQVDLPPGETQTESVSIAPEAEPKAGAAVNSTSRRQTKDSASKAWASMVPQPRGTKTKKGDATSPNATSRKRGAEEAPEGQGHPTKKKTPVKPKMSAPVSGAKPKTKVKLKSTTETVATVTSTQSRVSAPLSTLPSPRGKAPEIGDDEEESDQENVAVVPPRARRNVTKHVVPEEADEDIMIDEELSEAKDEEEDNVNGVDVDVDEVDHPNDDDDATRLFDDEAPRFTTASPQRSRPPPSVTPSPEQLTQAQELSTGSHPLNADPNFTQEYEVEDTEAPPHGVDKENNTARPLMGARAQKLAEERPAILGSISNSSIANPPPSPATPPALVDIILQDSEAANQPWKERTNIVLATGSSGKTVKSYFNLTAQNTAIQEVIREAIIKAFKTTILESKINPFSANGLTLISRRGLIEAADVKFGGENDIAHRLEAGGWSSYTSPLTGYTSHRVRMLLTDLKSESSAVIKASLGLEHTEDGRTLAKKLSELNSYIYPFETTVFNTIICERSAPFRNPAIKKAINAAFFSKNSRPYQSIRSSENDFRSSDTEKPLERELPKTLIAFTCVMIYNVLQGHQMNSPVAFGSSGLHEATYSTILALLNEYETRRPDKYHSLMHDLYNAAVGSLPLATNPNHEEMIASVAWDAIA
ncbi:hypothetical protein PM082_019639 [Marasmius tenuissimus]|nr:hypothetical protein PM082_019639 [Marasmius tenuissimus]